MKPTFKDIWITINILLAAAMVYLAFTKGFSSTTYWIMAITHGSILLYYFYRKEAVKNEQ